MQKVFFCYPLNFFSRWFLQEASKSIARNFRSEIITREDCTSSEDDVYNAIYESWAVCLLPPHAGMKTDHYINYVVLMSYKMDKGIFVMSRDFKVVRLNDIIEGIVETLTETKT